MVVGTDTNAMSVIQYAVDFLQVVHCLLRRLHLGILLSLECEIFISHLRVK